MADSAVVPNGANAAQGSRLHVMVIDDSREVRDGLSLLLAAEGHTVVCCSGGAQALGALRERPLPDLIVLDLIMPAMDGWELRIELKRDPRLASIPVVALSADHSAEAQAIDAAAYLSKPVGDRTFLETIRRVGDEVLRARSLARASEFHRLVSLGSLVGGLAHEVNNPLAAVHGTLELVQRQLIGLVSPLHVSQPFEVASALRAIERAQDGVARITDVVRCVSMFASADPHSIELLDVNDVLESSLQVAANELRHSAVLVREYEPLPHVRGSAARLGQVFLNMLLNAAQAMRKSPSQAHTIRVHTSADAKFVTVSITHGLDPARGEQTTSGLDPLGSTAEARLSLPFGLTISRELVDAMGGSIELVQARAGGTSFRIRVPTAAGASHPPPALRQDREPEPQRSVVMVVDDNLANGELFAAQLSDDYDVVVFTSSRAALASMLERDYALILCDVMMPAFDGIELFEAATRARPELHDRFVFITGGAFVGGMRATLRAMNRPTLMKPCSRAELLAMVHGTIAAAQD